MHATLNIGLREHTTGPDIDLGRVFESMRRQGIHTGHWRVQLADTLNVGDVAQEDTLVIEVEATGEQVYRVAVELQQDAIAVWDRRREMGALIGPKAKEWGEFDPQYFNYLGDR